MSRVAIDPNVRVRGNLTYAGFEDVEGDLPSLGAEVEVFEVESGLYGTAEVADLDEDARLIYLRVEWSALRFPNHLNDLTGMYVRDPRTSTTGPRRSSPL